MLPFPIFLDLVSIGGTDYISLEKHHDALHILLLLSTGANQSHAFLPYPWDFKQTVSVILYYIKCGQSEARR